MVARPKRLIQRAHNAWVEWGNKTVLVSPFYPEHMCLTADIRYEHMYLTLKPIVTVLCNLSRWHWGREMIDFDDFRKINIQSFNHFDSICCCMT